MNWGKKLLLYQNQYLWRLWTWTCHHLKLWILWKKLKSCYKSENNCILNLFINWKLWRLCSTWQWCWKTLTRFGNFFFLFHPVVFLGNRGLKWSSDDCQSQIQRWSRGGNVDAKTEESNSLHAWIKICLYILCRKLDYALKK